MTRESLSTTPKAAWACVFLACLFTLGCGGEDKPATPDKPAPALQNQTPAPPPGELVVEPSEAPLKIGKAEIDTLALLRDLLQDPSLAPEGYTIEPDRASDRSGQVRLIVEPAMPSDDTLVRQAADETFAALSAAFAERIEQAARDEQEQLLQRIDTLKSEFTALQQEQVAFSRARVGLPDTDESSLKRRQFQVAMDQALKAQIEQQDTADALARYLDRKRYPTLVRIR